MSASPDTAPAREARHLLITGHVQGVGFRWHMVQQATRLGLAGWVRNRRDGSVEAQASGGDEQLAALIAWARNGPTGARVAQVHVERTTDCNELSSGFVQKATE